MIDIEYAEVDAAAPPLDMLAHYFDAHGWGFERLGDDEIVATVEGSWTKYQLRALWRAEERVLQFIAFPDIRVPTEKRAHIHETLSIINEQMWLGHFEMWSSDGTLAFRQGVMLDEGDGGISLGQTETVVEAAIDECERYYPVFNFVLWGAKTPREALEAALVDTAGEA